MNLTAKSWNRCGNGASPVLVPTHAWLWAESRRRMRALTVTTAQPRRQDIISRTACYPHDTVPHTAWHAFPRGILRLKCDPPRLGIPRRSVLFPRPLRGGAPAKRMRRQPLRAFAQLARARRERGVGRRGPQDHNRARQRRLGAVECERARARRLRKRLTSRVSTPARDAAGCSAINRWRVPARRGGSYCYL